MLKDFLEFNMDTIVYEIDNNLYINLTNRCNNACEFCVRNFKEEYEHYSLWLKKEPTVEEVEEELNKKLDSHIKEVVFCGYGEPLYCLDKIVEIGKFLREKGVKTRLNTNGQARLISGQDTAKKLKGSVDVVSISLNATDAKKYASLCHPVDGEEAFFALLDFADDLYREGVPTVFSVVDSIGQEEIDKAHVIADTHHAVLRVRELIV